MASHGRQGLINSICIYQWFVAVYQKILKHTETHTSSLFFIGLTPHPTYYSAWLGYSTTWGRLWFWSCESTRFGACESDLIPFAHPLLGPLLKKLGGIFSVRFQHWLPQHVNKRTKGPLIHPETAYWKMPPSDVKCHSTKTSLRKPSSFTDVSDFVKNSGTYDRLKAS